MPRVPGQSGSNQPPAPNGDNTHTEGSRRNGLVLPSDAAGWAKLVAAVAGLVAAVSAGVVAVIGKLAEVLG